MGALAIAMKIGGFPLKLTPLKLGTGQKLRRRRWVMVIDLSRCDGCRLCTKACTEYHYVPKGQEWIKIFEMHDEIFKGSFYLPRPCMHCRKAPCVKVCPVGATYHTENGAVIIDHERCIGCRLCMAACPYQARYFNWEEPEHTPEELRHKYSPLQPWPHRKGVVEKCDFCEDLGIKGSIPPCAAACPRKAIYYGDQYEDVVSNGAEVVKFSELIREKKAFCLKEELGTEPSVYYLPPRGD